MSIGICFNSDVPWGEASNGTNNQRIIHCYECEHCFKNKRSDTGYSCTLWGYDDFACSTILSGFCHKAKAIRNLDSLEGFYMFERRIDAEEIVDQMKQAARRYGVVTRADFKDLLDIPANADDHNYGWIDSAIEKIRAVYTPRGYFIELPRSVIIY